MTRRVFFLDEFWCDVQQQAEWYNAQRTGLGARFAMAVDAATLVAERRPQAHLEIGGGYRRVRVKRFPHKVVFAAEPDQIVFVGVIHDARDFEDWLKKRAPS